MILQAHGHSSIVGFSVDLACHGSDCGTRWSGCTWGHWHLLRGCCHSYLSLSLLRPKDFSDQMVTLVFQTVSALEANVAQRTERAGLAWCCAGTAGMGDSQGDGEMFF